MIETEMHLFFIGCRNHNSEIQNPFCPPCQVLDPPKVLFTDCDNERLENVSMICDDFHNLEVSLPLKV